MNRDALTDQLIREEGMVLHVYDDSLGHPTLGVGRLVSSDRGISEAEAIYLLDNDITLVCQDLDRNVPWWGDTPECVQHALCDLAFNLDIVQLLKFSKTLALLEASDCQAASIELLDPNLSAAAASAQPACLRSDCAG